MVGVLIRKNVHRGGHKHNATQYLCKGLLVFWRFGLFLKGNILRKDVDLCVIVSSYGCISVAIIEIWVKHWIQCVFAC